jgi:hypothetical protein
MCAPPLDFFFRIEPFKKSFEREENVTVGVEDIISCL